MGNSVKPQPFVKMFGSRGKITPRQEHVYELYQRYQSLSEVARRLGITPANVLKNLARRERNICILNGIEVPSVGTLLKSTKDGTSSYERASLILACKNGVTTEQFDHRPLMLSEEESFEEEKPEPRRIFATGEKVVKRTIVPLPKRGVMTIITAYAQDATPVHDGLWANIEAYAEKLSARGETKIWIAPGTYNKGPFGDPGVDDRHFLDPHEMYELDELEIKRMVFFDHRLSDHIIDHRHEIDGILDFCAEMNTLPTAVTPLSGLQTYTGPRWGVFPHAKQHLESIPRIPGHPYKANLTTGTVTLPNYIRKKSGMKAEHHHTLGFAIIEVMPDGRFWVRTVHADADTGSFHDLDHRVEDGRVYEAQRVATISYGDIHREKLDPEVARLTWGFDMTSGKTKRKWQKRSLLDRLRPEYQFFHDVSDFSPRNHHNLADPHFWAMTRAKGEDSVEAALSDVAGFLSETGRTWCKSIVIQSNHDNAFVRWLKEADISRDPINAEIYHRANFEIYRSIREKREFPPIFEDTLRRLSPAMKSVGFIDENSSFVRYGVEYSQHGHIGPSGSRGSPTSLARVAPKLTTGHTHAPGIRDGLFTGGVCQLKMDYARGPTGWAIAHVIGHLDGSRQILFLNGDAFHA